MAKYAWQVSFGIHVSEEAAARQYDRALIVEKGRAAKTNFPLADYDAEVADYEAMLLERRVGPWCNRQRLLVRTLH